MIRQININGYDKNFSYFVIDESTNEIAIVDPGDIPLLIAEIEQDALTPKVIWITHSHFDHVSGVAELVEKYGIPVYIHKNAQEKLEISGDLTVAIEDGDLLKIGALKFEVLYTPGHIDDAVCFLVKAKNNDSDKSELLTGDTVFVEGCGRADLEGSNVEDLYKSLVRLKKLPEETLVYPGHDYGSKQISTIGWEKKHNKYFRCEDLASFKKLRLGR